MKPVVRDRFHFASVPQEDLDPETYFIELEKSDILGSLLVKKLDAD